MKTPDDIIHPDGSITRFKPTAYTLLSQIGATCAKMQRMSEADAKVRKFIEADAKMQKIMAPILKANRQHEGLFFAREVIPPPTVPAAEHSSSQALTALPTHTPAPVSSSVDAISAAQPAPAVAPAPTPAATPLTPIIAGPVQSTPAPTSTPAPIAGQSSQLAGALTSHLSSQQLKNWLSKVGLIYSETGMAKPTIKPYEWAAVREVLYKNGFIGDLSNGQAAKLFADTFGARVKEGTMKNRAENVESIRKGADKRRSFCRAYLRFEGMIPQLKTGENRP